MQYNFKQVDVFSSVSCNGNPVAVFLEADGLSSDDMQRIARWTNLSETTFVSKSTVADYKVRIFTPSTELPFAGHPTLGTAFALREAGRLTGSRAVQECAFGLVNLRFDGDKVFFELPQYSVEALEKPELSLPALGIQATEGQLITTGPRWITARATSSAALYDVNIDHGAMFELFKANNATGITLYALRESGGIDVRSFFEAFEAIVEDPVCGSGNAAAAVHIMDHGHNKAVGSNYQAFQGAALLRDGRIDVQLGDRIKIGGPCNTVFDGVAKFAPSRCG